MTRATFRPGPPPSVGRGWRRPLAGLVRALAVAPGFGLLLLGTPAGARAQEAVEAPRVILGSVPFTITVHGADDLSSLVEVRNAQGTLVASGAVGAREVREFRGVVVSARGELPLDVRVGDTTHAVDSTFAPGWFSILPPLLAIALALIFKEVITALLAGVWLGALAVAGYNPVEATWRLVDQYVVPALGDTDGGHTQIVVFSLMLGGMVGIVSRNGGTRGVVRAVAPLARNRRRGKVATAVAGLAIFFDDYANTLVVGNTMRPITDRLKVSREKLAYLVDSTAAPIAALVPVSTWVGYEVSLIGGGLTSAAATTTGADAALLASLSPYTVFIQTIPYLFYPILAFAFVLLTSFMNRDFGSMARAEARAAAGRGLYREGAMLATDTSKSFVDAKEGSPRRWWNAGIPVLTVVAVVLGGLYVSGRAAAGDGASLMDTFGAADPFNTLLWGSLAGCLVAAALTLGQRILTVHECIDAWAGGVKAMITAMVILTLAWSLGAVTQDIGTAAYLSGLLGGNLPLFLLPALVFVTSGAMAFATGTSWTTMAIMIPLVIPLTVSLAGGTGFADGSVYGILLGTTSSVLAGAIWGDHCSPISDTTVLSSTAAACDHVDHVRTQLPYALLVGGVGLALGSVGTALGLATWIALPAGVAVLAIILRVFGTPIPEIDGAAEAEAGRSTLT